jgi:hypothetical protein
VFLLTKPPAIDMLPGSALALIGLIVPIILFAYGLPKLKVLFLPQQAPLQSLAASNPEVEKLDAPSDLS